MVSQATQERAHRAKAIYNDRLKDGLERTHLHKFVAIEPDSGDYFLGDTMSVAIDAAKQRHPDRLFHIMRIGHEAAIHIGAYER